MAQIFKAFIRQNTLNTYARNTTNTAAGDVVMRNVNNTSKEFTDTCLDASILKDIGKVVMLITQGVQLVPCNPDTKKMLTNLINVFCNSNQDPQTISTLASAGLNWAAINPLTNAVISDLKINSTLENIQDMKDIHQAYSKGSTGDAAKKLINITSKKLTGLDTSNYQDPKMVAKLVDQGSKYVNMNPVTKEVISGVTDMISNNMTCNSQDMGKKLTNILALLLAQGVITYATFGLVNPASSALLGASGKIVASLLTNKLASAGTNFLEEQIERLTNEGVPPMEALNEVLDNLKPDDVDFNDHPVKLGCNFKYEKFKGKFTWRLLFGAAGSNKAKWASSSAIKRMMFDNLTSLNSFISDLNKISTSVLESTTYNDLDQLIKFMNEFKFQSKMNLENFYQSYNYKFRPQEDTAVFEMKLIHKLKKKYPGVGDNFFLVTAYMDIPENYTDGSDQLLGKSKVPKNFFHGHVAGAIKFSVHNGTRWRKGLILMDLTLGLEKPIILMEDMAHPHYDTTRRGFGKKITYRFAGPDNSYVLADIYKEQPSGEKKNHNTLSTHLYYVQKPYCSFLEVTFKPNLLIPVHGMVSRLANGFKKAQVNFRILPKNITGNDFYFNVVTFNSKTDAEGTGRRIPFESLTNLANLSTAEINDIKSAAEGLGISSDLLLGKLAAVKLLILDDSQLVDDLYQLNKDLNYVEEPSTVAGQKSPDLGDDGKPEENLVSIKSIQKMFSWAKTTVAYTWNQKRNLEIRNSFLNATENQNEFVKKTHITNTH